MSRRWLSRRLAIMATFALVAFAIVTTGAASAPGNAVGHETYAVTNLVSDGNVPALHTDTNLVNAWGLTATSASPWWVADNGTGTSTLYNGQGVAQPAPPLGPLVVAVDDDPTGAVANTTTDFVVRSGPFSGPAAFLFATEGGQILGWNRNVPPPPLSQQTEVGVDTGGAAVFKGLATGSVGASHFLYATDFVGGQIDVYDGNFHPVVMSFVDPKLPAGYGPFGIQNLGGRLFVTFAKQSGGTDELHGQGRGIVDEFATDGSFMARVATHGQLNAPWGLAMAPADFGRFSGDLLVGNFGSGRIDAFEPLPDGSFAFRGELRDQDHKPIVIDGLWGLGFGNGAGSGAANTLYFTAGPNDEADGLFGSITAD